MLGSSRLFLEKFQEKKKSSSLENSTCPEVVYESSLPVTLRLAGAGTPMMMNGQNDDDDVQ